MAVYRLAKVASELNRSTSAIAEFLQEKGHDVQARPTTKITEEMYSECLKEFSADKAMKEEADKLKEQKPARPTPSAPISSAPATPAPSAPVEEPAPVAKEEKPTPEIEPEAPTTVKEEKPAPVEEEKKSPLKVVGKIDLNAGKKKPKAEKKVAEPEAPKPQQKAEKTVEAEPVKPAESTKAEKTEKVVEEVKAPQKEEPVKEVNDESSEHIETKKEKLSGPKVLGKINLPTQKTGNSSLAKEARKDMQEIRKKRKRKEKGVNVKVEVSENANKENKSTGRDNKNNKGPVNQNQVRSNVRHTFNRMGGRKNNRGKKRQEDRDNRNKKFEEERRRKAAESSILKVTEFLTANELATMMNVGVTEVISKCFALGIMVSINQRLDAETIQLVASDFNYEVSFVDAESQIESIEEDSDNSEDLQERAPIVTVMGHVDHGKTSLLDHIRAENVIAGEAGGITQHIGAYEVTLKDGKKITFLDTPGHEAFTAMRARGAKVTDLAIIVIAADDSVMPQTREAIAHAQAAEVPMVFAFNKIDKPGANADKIREELSAMNILVEDWGGKFQSQEISAKKGLNIDELLEKVLLESEMMELKANPDRLAKGTVIEATQERGRGIVCTLLVQNGTLRVGDHMIAGSQYAKVRAMFNERGTKIDEAPPATPVKILGFSDAPTSGDVFAAMETEDEAKTLANKRQQLVREQGIRTKRHITLDEIGRRLAVGDFKELNIIVKADVDGSVEALTDALMKLSSEEIAVNVIHGGVGQITESDVLLASASDAIIIGFQVRPAAKAKQLA